jgi:V8-like Glu-specific endopeptidase
MLRAASLALMLICASAQALTVVGYDANTNNRFASGYPTAPVPNGSTSFIGAGMDWSGVGWDAGLSTRSVTMISDQYFVFAAHYAPGTTIQFLSPTLLAANPGNPAAALVSYTVQSTTQLVSPISGMPGDFSIGKLTTPLNVGHGIATYPVLAFDSITDYVGLQVLMYGHNDATTNSTIIGTNTISAFYHYDLHSGDSIDDTFAAGYTFEPASNGDSQFEGGDSGSPTFAFYQGRLALVGTHSAIATISGTQWSFDNFIPVYLDQLQALNVAFTTVPEPSRMLLMLIAAAAGMRRRRR